MSNRPSPLTSSRDAIGLPFPLRLTGTPANLTVRGETVAALNAGELRTATGRVPFDVRLTVLGLVPGLISICTSVDSTTKQRSLKAMFGSDGSLGEGPLFEERSASLVMCEPPTMNMKLPGSPICAVQASPVAPR